MNLEPRANLLLRQTGSGHFSPQASARRAISTHPFMSRITLLIIYTDILPHRLTLEKMNIPIPTGLCQVISSPAREKQAAQFYSTNPATTSAPAQTLTRPLAPWRPPCPDYMSRTRQTTPRGPGCLTHTAVGWPGAARAVGTSTLPALTAATVTAATHRGSAWVVLPREFTMPPKDCYIVAVTTHRAVSAASACTATSISSHS